MIPVLSHSDGAQAARIIVLQAPRYQNDLRSNSGRQKPDFIEFAQKDVETRKRIEIRRRGLTALRFGRERSKMRASKDDLKLSFARFL